MKKNKKTLLWQLISEEKNKISYVFGTIHIRDSRVLEGWETIEKKILQCNNYAGEIDLEKASKELNNNSLSLEEGQTLIDLIGPKKYKKLEKLLTKKLGLSIEVFNNSHPLLVGQAIGSFFLMKDLNHSQDEILWNFAKEKGLNCSGIETIEEQLQTFEKISMKESIKSLDRLLKKWDAIGKGVNKLVDAYLCKDPQKLYKVAKKQAKGMRKVLVTNRNKIMADRILELIDVESSFISIGAGHLGGKKGVLNLLKKKNVKIKPILMD